MKIRMKKIPWGVIAGVFLVFVIYLTIGIIVGWVILDRIEAETSGNASLFQESWQIALFVVNIICIAGMVGSLVMAIRSRVLRKAQTDAEVTR